MELSNPLELVSLILQQEIALVLAAKVLVYSLSALLVSKAACNVVNIIRNK